jgi:hypothetical protein
MACAGCAVFNRDNTPTLNFVEDKLLPDSGSVRYLAYPLLLPVAFTAVAVDAVVVHPISVADDALLDTKEALWERFDWEEAYFTECVRLVPRVVLTPVAFFGSFVGRSTLDLEPRGGSPRTRERHQPPPEGKRYEDLSAQAQQALTEERYDVALALAQRASDLGTGRSETPHAVMAIALLEMGNVDGFCGMVDRGEVPWGAPADVAAHVAHALRKANATDQMKLLLRLSRPYWQPGDQVVAALDELAKSADRAVAMQATAVLGVYKRDPRVQAVLDRIANGPDAVLAAAASVYLNWP